MCSSIKMTPTFFYEISESRRRHNFEIAQSTTNVTKTTRLESHSSANWSMTENIGNLFHFRRISQQYWSECELTGGAGYSKWILDQAGHVQLAGWADWNASSQHKAPAKKLHIPRKLKKVSIRHAAKILGNMAATIPGNKFARLFSKNLEIYKNFALQSSCGNFDTFSLYAQNSAHPPYIYLHPD